MASNHTEHYGLSLWEPGDAFLREEFNADHQRIDGGLWRIEGKADRALEGLVPVQYDLFQLLLQNYYEQKTTAYKKGLMFDGFLDWSMVDGLDEGLAASAGTLTLSRVNIQSAETPNADQVGALTAPVTEAEPVMAFSSAQVTGVRLIWKAGSTAAAGRKSILFRFYVNSILHHFENRTLDFTAERQEGVLTLNVPIPVKGGDEVSFTCQGLGDQLQMAVVPGTTKIYAVYCFRPTPASSGAMTTRAAELPACGTLWAWVRHTEGKVALWLKRDGSLIPFQAVGTAPAVDLKTGKSCTETAFRLDRDLPAGASALRLDLELDGADTMHVYDYGLILV